MNPQVIFDKLWNNYIEANPHAKKVYDLFVAKGDKVINDHIAFRTFDDPRIDIDVLSKVFIDNGYQFADSYHFPEKKLFAKHFEIPGRPDMPKVFISQLLTSQFSIKLQDIVKQCVDSIPGSFLRSNNLISSGVLWSDLSFENYEMLRQESEYAAWLYANGFTANHFTVNVNALVGFKTLSEVNDFLKDNGFAMNNPGNEIKGSPSSLLEQSSIKAGLQNVKFVEGIRQIPSCYYEFALRYPDKNGRIYNGFIAASANQIFESTDFYKG